MTTPAALEDRGVASAVGASAAPQAARRAEVCRRLDTRRREEADWSRHADRLANARLAVFIAAAGAAWLAFGAGALHPAFPALGFLGFAALVVLHDRVIRGRDRAARAVGFYEAALARLEDRWAGAGNAGERFREPHHPYADDLDCFGHGSLFERLCVARTAEGEAALARWLLVPAAAEEVRARQVAVRELAPRLDLREEVAMLGADVRAGLHAEALRAWGARPLALPPAAVRVVAPVLASLSVGALVAWLVFGAGAAPFGVALLLQGSYALALRRRVRPLLRGLELPARELDLLSELLRRIEQEPLEAPRLRALRGRLDTEGAPPSRRIAELRRLLDLLDARRNQFFLPIGALLLWTTQLAFAVERWRATCGPHLADWIEAIGEFEALSSLAGFAWELPDATDPEIASDGPRYEGEALGHPLLPADRRVCNDVRLGGDVRVLVVSGSNMSGKSTLLRTVGVNVVLAFAGAPVCARRLVLSPLALGASIRIHDSLLEGSSRFYAEILRLRQIVGLAEGERPILFLLDEILHGTNSHDRGIGAEAVVRGLMERGAIGLVTTHDLALARVADAMAPVAANVHFEDHLEAGKMAFDYRLRPGVVEKSNALELMRSVGLDV